MGNSPDVVDAQLAQSTQSGHSGLCPRRVCARNARHDARIAGLSGSGGCTDCRRHLRHPWNFRA